MLAPLPSMEPLRAGIVGEVCFVCLCGKPRKTTENAPKRLPTRRVVCQTGRFDVLGG
jgi:hypothetical protein